MSERSDRANQSKRLSFTFKSLQFGGKAPQFVEQPYARMDPKSNFSTRGVESALLGKLGMQTNVQMLNQADTYHAMMYAAQHPQTNKDVVYSAETREILREHGYEWRNAPSLKEVTPETALYLDAYVRATKLSEYLMRDYQEEQRNGATYHELRQRMEASE